MPYIVETDPFHDEETEYVRSIARDKRSQNDFGYCAVTKHKAKACLFDSREDAKEVAWFIGGKVVEVESK